MAPEAVGLAVLVHVVAGLGLWWVALHRPPIAPLPDPVDIVIEQPKSAETPPPPPPPPQQARKPPEPQAAPPEGLAPEAERTADKRSQRPPSADADKDIGGRPPRSFEQSAPSPPLARPLEQSVPASPPDPPPRMAAAQPHALPQAQPVPRPEPPPARQAAPLPPPPSPPVQVRPQQPPPTAHPPAVVHQPPPAVQPQQPRPEPQVAHPPPAVSPQPSTRPTPQVMLPQVRPPQIARRQEPQSSSPLVNPAETYNRALVSDNYLWQVVRKLRGYRYLAHGQAVEAVTVVQIVIARDGQLIDVHVARSSGFPEMDRGVLGGVRAGSPYTPLPPSIPGDRATFTLPIVSVPQAQ